jgi:AraC-like DNA-binding protein
MKASRRDRVAIKSRNKLPGVRRETKFLSDGSYAFRDWLTGKGKVTTNIITGRAWLLECFEVEAGTLSFLSGNARITPLSSTFWVFYPPFSFCRPSLAEVRGTVLGRAGTAPVPRAFQDEPFVFESTASIHCDSLPAIFATAANRQSVEVNPRASSLSRKARTLIAGGYVEDPSIAGVADRLGVSHAHLSRQFRRDYGVTPRDYLHQLRIADVPFRLAQGESIAEVSWGAGYRDLTRFYVQFRKATQTPPALCRQMVAPGRR